MVLYAHRSQSYHGIPQEMYWHTGISSHPTVRRRAQDMQAPHHLYARHAMPRQSKRVTFLATMLLNLLDVVPANSWTVLAIRLYAILATKPSGIIWTQPSTNIKWNCCFLKNTHILSQDQWHQTLNNPVKQYALTRRTVKLCVTCGKVGNLTRILPFVVPTCELSEEISTNTDSRYHSTHDHSIWVKS